MIKYKRVPYGVTDFELMNTENYYYVDKTAFIHKIENAARFLFFLRPRRFGKSLLLAILEDYYDITKAHVFDTFFGNTYIGKNPTENRNAYLLLRFNFSAVSPESEKVQASFEDHCRIRFWEFNERNKQFLDSEYFEKFNSLTSASSMLDYLLNYCSLRNLKVFLAIDEYDNFSNTILADQGKEAYERLTHGDSFFRHFFNVIKTGTTSNNAALSRLFITGVSPLTMNDVTSGFNIGTNISFDANFNEMVGFTTEEVSQILHYYYSEKALLQSPDELLPIMSKWYNNYRFSPKGVSRMFNSDMVWFFVSSCIAQKEIPMDLSDNFG